MSEMFDNATNFNQYISTWAEKTGDVDTEVILRDSGCPLQSNPNPNAGP